MPESNQFETKRLAKPFTFKGVDGAEGKIAGHGSVFDDPHPTSSWMLGDDWVDIVRPGAFRRTLADHKSRGVMPAMLLQHDKWSLPCGAWTAAAEDADGLAVEGLLLTDSARPEVKDLYPLMKIGAVSGLSIGFCPVKAKLDEKAKTRELIEVEVSEISVVTFPGQDRSRVTDVKSADPALLKRRIEAALRDAGLSRQEAKALIADGFKSLAQRDAAADGNEERSAAEAIAAHLRGLTDTIRRTA
jgi:HK97 family phage prohead protease